MKCVGWVGVGVNGVSSCVRRGWGGRASLIECYCFKSRSGGSSLEGYICDTGGVRLYIVDAGAGQ